MKKQTHSRHLDDGENISASKWQVLARIPVEVVQRNNLCARRPPSLETSRHQEIEHPSIGLQVLAFEVSLRLRSYYRMLLLIDRSYAPPMLRLSYPRSIQRF